tara:strand:+ start:1912 stop:2280 length:369 start_codon:yes stop_codon:yes gene_type:complete
MSSTRNRNSISDYKAYENRNENIINYKMYENSQYGKTNNFLNRFKLPESTQPTRIMHPNNFSNNPIDIESQLRGINSTNLVGKSFNINPDLRKIDSYKLYERVPLMMPKQITNEQYQRPLFN